MKLNELKLARPSEVPLLKMAGYEVLGNWSDTFVLMQSRHHSFDRFQDSETSRIRQDVESDLAVVAPLLGR